jgi:integrase
MSAVEALRMAREDGIRLGVAGADLILDADREPAPRVLEALRRHKAGIEKRVHAHGLRHTRAAELAREGVPMNVIQAQLGHSNLGTTSRYLAHIAPAEVIRVMQGREWEV